MSDRIQKIEQQLAALGEDQLQSKQRIDLLNELVLEVGWDDPQRAAQLSQEAYALSKELSYPKGLARGIYHQAIQHYYLGHFEEALDKGKEALGRFRKIGDRDGEADVLSGHGYIFWGLGDYEKALTYMHHALTIFKETGNRQRESWVMTSIGGVYENIDDLENALQCHQKSLEIFRDLGDRLGEGRALTGIGTVYHRQGRNDSALVHHTKALELFRETNSRTSESRALNDLGAIYQSQGEFEESLECHSRALRIRQDLGNKRATTTSLLHLGRLHNRIRMPQEALDYLHQALVLAKETRERPKIYQAHDALSEAYELLGDTFKAMEHHKAFHQIHEEVFNSETSTRLKNLQIRFEVENAEKEAEIHRLKNIELAQALERLKATQSELIQSEKMAALGKLIASVAHEVNTPAGVINSSIDVSQRAIAKIMYEINRSDTIAEARNNHDLQRFLAILSETNQTVADAGKRITKIIETLRNFARLDEAELQPAVDIHEGLDSTLALIAPQLGERVRVVKRFQEIPKIECYPNQLNQLFMTLLVNASEAIETEGAITVSTAAHDNRISIKIADTGRGIPRELLENVFDVGFSQKGSRIRMRAGLANCYAIVQKHRGDIRVESEVGKGTVFETSLPIKLTA